MVGGLWPSPSCSATAPRPRIFAYSIPTSIAPEPTTWRLTRALLTWLRASRYWEPDGDCADFFLVPTHPSSAGGDAGVARMFSFIRSRWPYWNRTRARGEARHLLLLPCDHGAGDCESPPRPPGSRAGGSASPSDGRVGAPAGAYGRPMRPLKWAHLDRASHAPRERERPIAAWGGKEWELLNPASVPQRPRLEPAPRPSAPTPLPLARSTRRCRLGAFGPLPPAPPVSSSSSM